MIIVRLSGGMGNQMFQYALGRRLSLQYGVPLKLDTAFLLHRVSFPALLRPDFVFRKYDLDVFKAAATIADKDDMKWWQRPILSGKIMLFIDAVLRKAALLPGWERAFTFDEHVLSLGPDSYLVGFWQSQKYFSDIKEALIKDFTVTASLPVKSQALMEEMKKSNSVCVHVRRKDMASKSFHGAIDAGYYQEGMAYIAQHADIDTIYVFSDDIEWCKKNLAFPQPTVFVEDEYFGIKGEGYMTLMQACKHFIIPNSTFSWWAAWLGIYPEKIVVAPKKWFEDGHVDSKDLIPPEWVRI